MSFKKEIKSYLSEFQDLPDEAWHQFESKLVRRSLEKEEVIQDINVMAPNIGFLCAGALKVEEFNEESGDFRVIFFNDPALTQLVGVLESVLQNKRSAVKISAITHSTIYLIPYAEIELLYDSFPKADRLGRKLMEQQYLFALEQGRFRQNKGFESKYQQFKKTFPEVNALANAKDVASYLGMEEKSFYKKKKIWDRVVI